MKIADTGKADAQPLSPEVWEAQQDEIARLSRRVAELEQYNNEKDDRVRELVAVEKGLHARVDELEQENEQLCGDLVERLCRVLGLQGKDLTK